MAYFSPVIENAIRLASHWHGQQLRKGGEMTQFAHVAAVAILLARAGFEETIVAAGYCHDLLEDTLCSVGELREACGEEIVKIVQALTPDPRFDNDRQWQEAKEAYIHTVRLGSDKAKAIACADRIHGLQSLIGSLDEFGLPFFDYFHKGPEEYLWFEDQMCLTLQTTWSHALVQEYDQLLDEFVKLLETLDAEEQQNISRQPLPLAPMTGEPPSRISSSEPLLASLPSPTQSSVLAATALVDNEPTPTLLPMDRVTRTSDKEPHSPTQKASKKSPANPPLFLESLKYLSPNEAVLLLPAVLKLGMRYKELTNHLIQDELGVNYLAAYRLLKELKRLHVIKRADSPKPRMVDLKQAKEWLTVFKSA